MKKVLLSAPPKGTADGIYMIGLNADKIGAEPVISNASCTTNCVAPVAKVMVKEFGVVKAAMTTLNNVTAAEFGQTVDEIASLATKIATCVRARAR